MVDLRGHSTPPVARTDADPPENGAERDEESPALGSALDRVLSLVDERTTDLEVQQDLVTSAESQRAGSSQLGGYLRAGFVEKRQGMTAQVFPLGGDGPVSMAIAPHVDGALIDRAVTDRSLVLVGEWNDQPHIIGLIQTTLPDQMRITGKSIVVEASEQLTLRSGRAAIALRSDGALEMVGTRIAATSRGVFRLIGRALRLN